MSPSQGSLWFDKLKTCRIATGFLSSKADCSLFVKFSSHYCLYVLFYVNDILITRSDATVIDQLVLQLHNTFALKDLGPLNFFLGIKVHRSNDGNYAS